MDCAALDRPAALAARIVDAGYRQVLVLNFTPYTHRVAISNERLVSLIDGTVTCRVPDNAQPGKKKRAKLPAKSVLQRFLQHVLPQGFKRIRHYGILASCHKREKLAS